MTADGLSACHACGALWGTSDFEIKAHRAACAKYEAYSAFMERHLVRSTHEWMGMPADAFRGVDRSATPEKLSGAVLASQRRPDGFDQRQVDAAKAALLAPAPPRYPRRAR